MRPTIALPHSPHRRVMSFFFVISLGICSSLSHASNQNNKRRLVIHPRIESHSYFKGFAFGFPSKDEAPVFVIWCEFRLTNNCPVADYVLDINGRKLPLYATLFDMTGRFYIAYFVRTD